jgi:hypothetical protein
MDSTSTSTNKQELAEAVVESLSAVVDHFWCDERDDYFALPPEERRGHIFEALLRLVRWIQNPSGETSYFGGCPLCGDGQNDGYFSIGRAQWMVCHIHQTKWCIGENFFRSWRDEAPELWQEIASRYASYEEVNPF